MPSSVTIDVVGRAYEITCDDGQESAVLTLGADVDRRAKDLMRTVGQVGDARLLVMVALSMADEIAELRRGTANTGSGADDPALDAALAHSLDGLINRLESIAVRLEKA